MAGPDKYPEFPRSFGVLLYPQFELLDMAGPLEALNCLARKDGFNDMSLSVISNTLDPVNVGPIAPDNRGINFSAKQNWVPTHTFETAPDIEVLLVPGGLGAMKEHPFGAKPDIDGHTDFIRRSYFGLGRKKLKYIISVCNGAQLLLPAGVLDGRKATTNKDGWKVITAGGPKTEWIGTARWVADGNVWTTSGVSAGTDGMLAWMSSILPEELVHEVTGTMEWIRAKEPENDPFSEWFKTSDVPRKQ